MEMEKPAKVVGKGKKPQINKPSEIESLQSFVERMKKLLAREHKEEVETLEAQLKTLSNKELTDRGLILPKLEITNEATGIGGKHLVRFETTSKDPLQNGVRFTPGDIVSIKDEKSQETIDSGVVYRATAKWLQVALSKPNESDGWGQSTYSLVLLTNDTTYKRMEIALNDLLLVQYEHEAVRILFDPNDNDTSNKFAITEKLTLLGDDDERTTNTHSPSESVKFELGFTPFDLTLNQSQLEAVAFALASNDLALIHGPPGTGKTTTVVEFIRQCIARGEKVLVCGPSNISVDNIAEKLVQSKVKMCRMGHPARVMENLQQIILDVVVSCSNGGEVVRGIREDMDALGKKLKNRTYEGTRQENWQEWRRLRKDLKERECKATEDVLSDTSVVLATCSGAGNKLLRNMKFDVVVIDEAAQALEAVCWIPLRKGKRFVLAGDHLQLPPTIHSISAAKEGLEVTLFERIMKRFGSKVSRLLNLQYRMNETIMNWSSAALYEAKIFAHEDVKTRLLTDFEHVRSTDETTAPLVLIDTQGCDLDECKDEEGSVFNEGEAQVVLKYLEELTAAGVKENQIAVITPYYAQVKLLRDKAREAQRKEVKINTVDGFQGREKEVVIISMVRSNNLKEIGFLAERRRMNVAVTRARRHCCIVCNGEFVGDNSKFLKEMVDYFEEHGVYLSAASYTSSKKSDFTDFALESKMPVEVKTVKPITNDPFENCTPQQKLFVSRLKQLKERSREIDKSESLCEEEKLKLVVKFNNTLSVSNMEFLKTTASKMEMFVVPYTEKNCLKADVYLFPPPAKVKPEKEPKLPAEEPKPTTAVTEPKKPIPNSNGPANKNKLTQPPPKPKLQPTTNQKKKGTAQVSDCDAILKRREEINQMTGDQALEAIYQSRTQNKCYFPSCANKVHTMSTLCEFCHEKYCLSHGLPHLHGCGDKARDKAYSDFRNTNDTNRQPKKSPEQQKVLQDNMKKKLAEQAASRSKKQPEKSSNQKGGKK